MTTVQTIAALLADLRQNRPSSPRLIWYGPGGERVELSGRVLDNWVAKTSNLLVDELDADQGTTVLLDMPAHWRSLCWALAGWQTGSTIRVETSDAAASPDIIVTTDPWRWAEAVAVPQYLVAVALGALDMKWNGQLPKDAIDYAGEVRSHPDEYLGLATGPAAGTALQLRSGDVSYARLLSDFADDGVNRQPLPEDTAGPQDNTVLIDAGLRLSEVLQLSLGVWSSGGSVVLLHPDVEATDALRRSERVNRSFRAGSGR